MQTRWSKCAKPDPGRQSAHSRADDDGVVLRTHTNGTGAAAQGGGESNARLWLKTRTMGFQARRFSSLVRWASKPVDFHHSYDGLPSPSIFITRTMGFQARRFSSLVRWASKPVDFHQLVRWASKPVDFQNSYDGPPNPSMLICSHSTTGQEAHRTAWSASSEKDVATLFAQNTWTPADRQRAAPNSGCSTAGRRLFWPLFSVV